MINKNKNNWVIVLLILSIAILVLSSSFIFSLKNQAFSDIKSLVQNQNSTIAVNSKFSDNYKSIENNFIKDVNNSINPMELTNTITNIYNSNQLTIGDYKKEIENIRTEFGQSLEAWKKGVSTDSNFEAKAKLLTELDTLSTNVNMISTSQELEVQKNVFANLQTTYSIQLDTYNKKSFINGVRSAQNEINDLIEYLKKYPNLSASLGNVEKYKTELVKISEDAELAKYKYQDLENKVNSEIRPLLASGFAAKQSNEESLRQKAIVTQSKTEGTITTAPISTGKVILVNKSQQKMYTYQDGNLLRSTSVTTGRIGWPTDTGTYSILTKERSRRLKGSGQGATWDVFVNYWMLFNAGDEEGIHDAPWRNGIFGNPLTESNGSRGCVNTPDDTIGWLFEWANIGTPVVVQD